ncbi:hypothetical protein HDU89_008936 [Geranomyces variabilis]|nr:hypothetical protein HDU89_008936 [Geranomyces variabilis]
MSARSTDNSIAATIEERSVADPATPSRAPLQAITNVPASGSASEGSGQVNDLPAADKSSKGTSQTQKQMLEKLLHNVEELREEHSALREQISQIAGTQATQHIEVLQQFQEASVNADEVLQAVAALPALTNTGSHQEPFEEYVFERITGSDVITALTTACEEQELVRDCGHTMITKDFVPFFRRFMEARGHSFRNGSAVKRALDNILQEIENTAGPCLQQELPKHHPAKKFHARGDRNNCMKGWRVKTESL